MNQDLPDEEVIVKISICQKCDKLVRAAVKHMMDKRDINDFAAEAMMFNLKIIEQPLLQYRDEDKKWCNCQSHYKTETK